jgi:hypothetical protein
MVVVVFFFFVCPSKYEGRWRKSFCRRRVLTEYIIKILYREWDEEDVVYKIK